MIYYKTSNLSIQDDQINATKFINELLLDYYDSDKFDFYHEKYDTLRKDILNNQMDRNIEKKVENNLFYNKKDICILRKKDNKIIKLYRILNNHNSHFNYTYYIYLIKNKKIDKVINSQNNKINLNTINSIIYLYNNLF